MKIKRSLYFLAVFFLMSTHNAHGAEKDVAQNQGNASQPVLSDQAKKSNPVNQTVPPSASINISKLSKEDKPAVDSLPERAYKIGAGDVLNLSVWKDAALSRQVVVLPDGTVSLPLIGQLIAAGKTVAQLEQEIYLRIKRYLPEPVLDVNVSQVNSMLIYVIGKVRAPGRYPVQADINVLQALAMAGGLDKHADEDGIKIYREENNQTRFYTFEYDEVIDGDKLEQNIRLQRGDVVVVP